MSWRGCAATAIIVYAALAVAYMLIPIAVIAVFSFNDPAGKFNFTWERVHARALGERLRPPGAERRAADEPRAGGAVDR